MPYWKLQLPETLKAGAFETWVPKLELGNQREDAHGTPYSMLNDSKQALNGILYWSQKLALSVIRKQILQINNQWIKE